MIASSVALYCYLTDACDTDKLARLFGAAIIAGAAACVVWAYRKGARS